MEILIGACMFWQTPPGTRILMVDGPQTRLGQILLAGEVSDADPGPFEGPRTQPGWVLSHVTEGSGTYRHRDGREEPIVPGTLTVVAPGVPHTYGTLPGERWTEQFAVVTGPLFTTLADAGILVGSGPRPLRAPLSATVFQTVFGSRRATAGEHQLLALADWLVDAAPAAESAPSGPTEQARILLTADLGARVDLREVAAAVGLPYDTFRRRFAAEVGQAPLAYRNAHRLRGAASLLSMTTMTVRQVARHFGFNDEFHFSRRFHAHFGVPPSDYRRRAC
ncbi:AraC family transcriptional regulator [Streptomyces sp. CA-251251]|uniref:helix-turn-helix transcriptional regulator n=1 Tax=Streptomyces sp. CA-251251 TaxID=3240063 RepID=UPI003D9260BD